MNSIGLVAALSAFLGIWFGHIAVRKIEFNSPTLWTPAAIFCTGGLIFEWLSVTTPSLSVSTATGILGMTLLWDSLELLRQQRRVRNGHAPANPGNPRHSAMLAEPGSHATTLDVSKRDPIGKSVHAHTPAKPLTEN